MSPGKIQNTTPADSPIFRSQSFFVVYWHKGEKTPGVYFRWCLVYPLVEGDLHREPAAANFFAPPHNPIWASVLPPSPPAIEYPAAIPLSLSALFFRFENDVCR